MQGKHYALIHSRMADPFVTTTCDQLIKAFQPAHAATSVEFDEGGIYHLAHWRIPSQTDLTGHGFEDVHTSGGNNRDFHYAVINIDYANAFLSSSVQIAHADRERLINFQAQFLACNPPVLRGFVCVEQHIVLGEGVRGGKCYA